LPMCAELDVNVQLSRTEAEPEKNPPAPYPVFERSPAALDTNRQLRNVGDAPMHRMPPPRLPAMGDEIVRAKPPAKLTPSMINQASTPGPNSSAGPTPIRWTMVGFEIGSRLVKFAFHPPSTRRLLRVTYHG